MKPLFILVLTLAGYYLPVIAQNPDIIQSTSTSYGYKGLSTDSGFVSTAQFPAGTIFDIDKNINSLLCIQHLK